MAYMYAIQSICQSEGCKKPQTHRVCNQRNETVGTFCKKHAEQRLAVIEKGERKSFQERTRL